MRFSAREVHGSGQKKTYWECLCDCGKSAKVALGNLRSGQVTSCGCRRREALDKTTHGMSHLDVYSIWTKMLRRCDDPSDMDYGGRGIRVCERWRTLENFIADMGPRPPGTTIDRIDNEGHYQPGNCRWATSLTQANNKRSNRVVRHAGKSQTVAQWARELGLSCYTLYSRLNKLPPDLALVPRVRGKPAAPQT